MSKDPWKLPGRVASRILTLGAKMRGRIRVPAAGADVIAETILRAAPSCFGLFEIHRVSTPADLLNAGRKHLINAG